MRPSLLLAALALFAVLPAASAQGISPSHLRAAEELADAVDLRTVLSASADLVIQMELQRNPEIAPFEDVMRDFIGRTMGPEGLLPLMVELYAEAFTEAELREIAAFYRTPTGRRSIELMPALMARGAEIGRQLMAERRDELVALLEARARELERGN